MIALYDYDPMELSPNVDMEVGLDIYNCIYNLTIYTTPVRWSSTSRLVTSSPCSARWTMTASTWRSCAASAASCPGKTTFTALLYNNILHTIYRVVLI